MVFHKRDYCAKKNQALFLVKFLIDEVVAKEDLMKNVWG